MDPNSPDRLLESYRDEAWLSVNNLDKSLILDYFSRSPFFIPGSKLERESGETLTSSQTTYTLRPVTELENKAGVYLIQRFENGVCVSTFTCLGGTIVQCPPLHALVGSRVGRAAVHLSAALRTLRELEEAERAVVS